MTSFEDALDKGRGWRGGGIGGLTLFEDNRTASLIFGQYDQNLARIERRLSVSLNANGNHLVIKGEPDAVGHARRVLQNSVDAGALGPSRDHGRCRWRDPGMRLAGQSVSQRKSGSALDLRADFDAQERRRCAPGRRRRTSIFAN